MPVEIEEPVERAVSVTTEVRTMKMKKVRDESGSIIEVPENDPRPELAKRNIGREGDRPSPKEPRFR